MAIIANRVMHKLSFHVRYHGSPSKTDTSRSCLILRIAFAKTLQTNCFECPDADANANADIDAELTKPASRIVNINILR